MKVLWAPEALEDRLEIFEFIATDNPLAAIELDERFSDAAALLADFPEAGQRGVVPGTRELFPHESYRLVYEIVAEEIVILMVVHVSRQWPPI